MKFSEEINLLNIFDETKLVKRPPTFLILKFEQSGQDNKITSEGEGIGKRTARSKVYANLVV